MQDEDRSSRLASVAAVLHASSSSAPPPSVVPTSFSSVEEALSTFRSVLLHDATTCMASPLTSPPDSLYMHAVDLDTERPGVVSTTRPKPMVTTVEEVVAAALPPLDAEARQEAERAEDSGRVEAVSDKEFVDKRKKAKAALASHRASVQRRAKREEEEEEHGEEREAQRKERAREKREEAKRKRRAREEEEEDRGAEESPPPRPPSPPRPAPSRPDPPAPLERDEEEVAVHPSHAILPPRRRARTAAFGKHSVWASPVPLDRHLEALRYSMPSPVLLPSLLSALPSPHLTLVRGPPGTGKTVHVCRLVEEMLKEEGEEREARSVLVCAPTNVAAVGAYQTFLQECPPLRGHASLCVPASKIPKGSVVLRQGGDGRVVFATLSSRAGRQLHGRRFDTVVVDEAGQCSEALVWTLLRPSVLRLVLVGDTMQLPGQAASPAAEEAGHARSMMERLLGQGYPSTLLTVQRRMPPSIASFPSSHYYGGLLQSEVGEHAVDAEAASHHPYACLRVPGGSVRGVGTSFVNDEEASVCARLSREEAEAWPRQKTVVLCPYLAQCRKVLSLGVGKGVEVHSIDSFQGREADRVILCIVRTGREAGFWKEGRRLNVALTRAKKKMVVVGSFDWDEGTDLGAMRRDAEERGVVCTIESVVVASAV